MYDFKKISQVQLYQLLHPNVQSVVQSDAVRPFSI